LIVLTNNLPRPVLGHSFPPDIGQGINAGFMDVVALDRALRGVDISKNKPVESPISSSLGDALLAYQKNRGPEHRALIRLARFGAPFQVCGVGRFAWI